MDIIAQLSAALAARVAATAPIAVALRLGDRPLAGILWQEDLVVTSEQVIGDRDSVVVAYAGTETPARLAGRDPATNVALFRLASPIRHQRPPFGPTPPVGALTLLLGADEAGAPTARWAMVHAAGPEWHSMAGGRIEALIRLDTRLAVPRHLPEHWNGL